jgi:Zn-finger protein
MYQLTDLQFDVIQNSVINAVQYIDNGGDASLDGVYDCLQDIQTQLNDVCPTYVCARCGATDICDDISGEMVCRNCAVDISRATLSTLKRQQESEV